MKLNISFFLFFIAFISKAQVSIIDDQLAIPVSFYHSTDDFLNKNDSKNENLAILKGKKVNRQSFDSISKNLSLLAIKKVVDKKSLKRNEDDERSWALKYQNNYFFNLGYSKDVNSWGTWVKFDIIGKYCLIIIPEGSSIENLIGNNNGGLGLQGVLMKESTKWGKNFEDNGSNTKIIFIDTTNQKGAFLSRYKASTGNLLTKNTLKKLAKEHNVQLDVKNITYQEIINFIKKLNQE